MAIKFATVEGKSSLTTDSYYVVLGRYLPTLDYGTGKSNALTVRSTSR